jgi:hypothetical protein
LTSTRSIEKDRWRTNDETPAIFTWKLPLFSLISESPNPPRDR